MNTSAVEPKTLEPHQAAGANWLLDTQNGMLAWEPGVGKTGAAAVAAERARMDDPAPTLVLCLASARENWRRELLNFAIDSDNLPRVQILRKNGDVIDPRAEVVVTNWDKLLSPIILRRLRSRGPWSSIIADEAHVLAHATAKRTQLVYGGDKLHHMQTPLVKLARRFWPLTGTPMLNHPGDLWTHAHALWPHAIEHGGTPMPYWQWELAYCELRQTEYGTQVCGGRNLAELRERLAPFINRIKRKDVLDLPPLRIDTWPLDMETTSGVNSNECSKSDIATTLMDKLSVYGGNVGQFDNSTLDLYLSCIQSSFSQLATERRETGTLKAAAGALLLKDELEQGAPKTVVFCWSRDAIDVVARGLAPFKPAVLHGGTPDAKRDEEIDRFQNDPSCRVFVGQIKAAGASINLQAAERVVFVEASWSPADNDQALSRVYRKGQTKPVLVRFTYLRGSIDEAVNRALARKAAMILQVVQ